MIARLTNQWLHFDNITAWEEELVVERFSVENPNSRYIDSSAYQSWDGIYRKYSKKHRRLARPFLAELRLLARKKNLSLTVLDERGPAKYQPLSLDQIAPDFLSGIILKEFQIGAVKKLCITECGIVSIVTGGGKTEIMAAICKVMNCPTVIIAEQLIVIDQIRDRLNLRDVCEEPGLFYAGKMPTGELIIIGSIQSLVLPKKPEKPDKSKFKDTKSSTAAQKFKKARKRYEASSKGYKSRTRKARVLHKLIGKCEMILVDECDLAVGKTYQNLFRYWFKGRRRYGFCLAGDTIIDTTRGPRRLMDLAGESVNVLAHDGSSDVFALGSVIAAGEKDTYELYSDTRLVLRGSADHLLATDDGCYVRFEDVIPGHRVKCCNNGFIYDFEDLSAVFGILDAGPDLGDIPGSLFEFSRAYFNQDIPRNQKINDVDPGSSVGISDSRVLCPEGQPLGIEKLEKEKFVRRCEIPQISFTGEVITGFEFCGEFESSRGVSFSQRLADFSADLGAIGRITVENFFEFINSSLDCIWQKKCNGDSISLYHSFLDSLDDVGYLHRMFNTISLQTGGFPFLGVVERCTSINIDFSLPGMILVCRNGKPILSAILFKHFLFVCFESFLGAINNTWELLDTVWAQMSPKLPELSVWAAHRAFKYARTIITLYSNDVAVPGFAIIPFSFDDQSLSPSNGTPIYFCRKVYEITDIISKPKEMMYDVVDVERYHNFYADGILVHNSGTPYDKYKPVQRLVLNEHLGSVIYQQSRTQVENTGLIVPLEYYMFAFPSEDWNPKNSAAYDIALDEWLIYNENFHRLIKAICDKYPDEGTLILVDRHDLGHALNDLIPDSQFVYGETPKKQRPEMLQAFERRDKKVLIGGKNVRRGLDLSGGCENLVLATGGKLVSEFDQRLGRARRQNERGKARVFDFLFLCNKYLYEHSRNRLKAAIGMGYKTQVIFRHGSIDGEKFVRSRFRRPRFPARSQAG